MNCDTKIAAGIVTYNPDQWDRYENGIKKILEQVDKIYVFNNEDKLDNISDARIDVFSENENKGVAYALNRIMNKAKNDGYVWVLTMDQDSLIPDGLVNEYRTAIDNNENIGIVCPQVIDIRRNYMNISKEPKQEFVEFCITSASCTSIEAWEKIGGFDEWLFIDLVDNDFCKRLIASGYKILKLNDLVLNQEFGRIVPKNEKTQRFWLKVSKIFHNPNFAKFSYKKYVNPMRVYYTCRNIIYVNKKLGQHSRIGYKENYNCKGYVGFIISFILPSILRAQNKIAVIKAVINGTNEGLRKKVTTWSIKDRL